MEWLVVLGKVKRKGPGQPRFRLKKLVGDKGYSSPSLRNMLHRRGIKSVIPTKSNQDRQDDFDKELYRERNKVERAINRIKWHRRVATRYEKLACMYGGMILLACILEWL